MINNDLKSLIPRAKMDLIAAEKAVAAGFPTIEPILFELLEWLQDFNWPVAQILAPCLQSIGKPLAPHLRRILETDDEMWEYWVLDLLVLDSQVLAVELEDSLIRIAERPTKLENEANVDQLARTILRKFGLAVSPNI